MWADPRFSGVGFEEVALGPGERRDRLHNHYAVLITTSGKGILTCRGVRYLARRNSGYLLEPDQLWITQAMADDRWAYRTMYISRENLRALVDQLDPTAALLTSPTGAHIPGGESVEAARRALAVFQTRGLVVERVAALVSFAEMLVSGSSPGQTVKDEPKAATRIRQFLHEHCFEDVQTSHLANLVSLSRFHLIRVFHKAVGVPPHVYATLVRVRDAEQLLRAGIGIAEAADRAGFYDQSHLNRWFRRTLGVTPGQYRKAHFLRSRPTITGERIMAYQLRNGEKLWRYWARLRSAAQQSCPRPATRRPSKMLLECDDDR
jgi:AraC-like DNA-binding protein